MAGRTGSCWGDGEMTDLLGFGGFGGSRSKKWMDSFLMFLAAMSEGCAHWIDGHGAEPGRDGPDMGRRAKGAKRDLGAWQPQWRPQWQPQRARLALAPPGLWPRMAG